MKENYIPVEVYENQNFTNWYLDISNLKLSELTYLRKELLGVSECSIRSIDHTIYTIIGYPNQNIIRKERSKQNKIKIRSKKNSKKTHHRYK